MYAIRSYYALATPVDDTAITISAPGSKKWQPANFDKTEHGRVPLYEALANSYNLATVRVGMDVGVEKVIGCVRRLGVEQDFSPYPSFLLGRITSYNVCYTKLLRSHRLSSSRDLATVPLGLAS